jgi:hypothetical protein
MGQQDDRREPYKESQRMMKIWTLAGAYEGRPFATTHLTRKGAYVALIEDVWEYVSPDDDERYEDEAGKPCFYGTHTDLMEMTSDELRAIRDSWMDYLHYRHDGTHMYYVDVIETELQG